MFQRSQRNARKPVVALFTLALSVVVFVVSSGAQEAPRDSGSLIKPPTIKPPTASSQSSNRRVATSRRRRKQRVRRTKRSARATQRAASRVAGKPQEVQSVIVDSAGSMNNTAEPSPRPRTQRLPISFGVLNSRAISLPKPPYPAIARAANASGTVVVQVLIDEAGKVSEARAVSGHPLLREAAEDAARNARFVPTQLSGQPVKVSGVVVYNFVAQ